MLALIPVGYIQKNRKIKTNHYQKKSTQIVNENQIIILEGLGIKNMIRNRKLSRAIHQVAVGAAVVLKF